ncbi:hypothetical protein [Dyella acidisoli]|uniref:Uncharacterized protein n=1 Tax=Dyella acidisoli TaxID=1867834 RepID=A0ABQ5XQX7_9GAMM|nr:hypothetical protein [Dyella acidisoli]GLQ93792.1 hypothetical protein GCM10007901_27430 [Dyella acidisoli]
MKKLITLAATLILAQSASAKSLNGNVDATFSTENGNVFLTLVNKKTDTPATVTGVDLLIPQKNKKEAQKVVIFSGNNPIGSDTKIPLGTVEKLVSLLYPTASQDQIKAAAPTISDDQAATCTNCRQKIDGIGFHLALTYGSGVSQSILTGSFLHLTQPFSVKTFVLPAPNN